MNAFARTLTLGVALMGCFTMQAVRADEGSGVPAKSGLMPTSARTTSVITERELASLLPRLAKRLGVESGATLTMTKPTAPVTRIRALMATVRIAVEAEEIESYRAEMPEDMPSDMAQVPAWGRPYLAAAVMRGWCRADTAFAPKQNATWKFLEGVLAGMVHESEPQVSGTSERDDPSRAERSEGTPRPASGKFSGLIVDLGDLKLERSMSPRILDEDGQVVYPDPKHIPNIDYVQEHGILTYDKSVETAKRAGSRPLVVKALGVTGVSRTDVIVSKETAAQILEANRASKFLWKWAVSVVPGLSETKTDIAEDQP